MRVRVVSGQRQRTRHQPGKPSPDATSVQAQVQEIGVIVVGFDLGVNAPYATHLDATAFLVNNNKGPEIRVDRKESSLREEQK